MAKKKSALGKGLGALIDDANYESKPEMSVPVGTTEIDIDSIISNPYQPRSKFDQEALEELADSIKKLGIIQPLTLRKTDDDEQYQLIAGERRLKAARIAGLDSVPAFIREANDQEMLEFALVENIQREDLNPIEIAISYQRLMEECKVTQEVLSERIGKKRASITNYIRLLKLPAEIQIGIRDKQISFGHARALINIDEPKTQIKTYFSIINKGHSVRQVEEIVRKFNNKDKIPVSKKDKNILPEEYTLFANDLKENLQTNIQFSRSSNGKGKIVIPFKSDNELNRIMEILNKIKN